MIFNLSYGSSQILRTSLGIGQDKGTSTESFGSLFYAIQKSLAHPGKDSYMTATLDRHLFQGLETPDHLACWKLRTFGVSVPRAISFLFQAMRYKFLNQFKRPESKSAVRYLAQITTFVRKFKIYIRKNRVLTFFSLENSKTLRLRKAYNLGNCNFNIVLLMK